VRVEYDQVGSTQAEAVRLVRAGHGPGTVVVARSQSSGTGRLGRPWNSPRGGLYLSLVVELPPGALGLPPLAIAASLRRSLARLATVELRIKWPNDLVAAAPAGPPRKLAGILLDRPRVASGRSLAVVGVGVNVGRPPTPLPPELEGRVAFLEEFASPIPTLAELEETVVGAVNEAGRALADTGGRAEVIAECRENLFGVGHLVTVDGEDVGVLRSLENDGAVTVERKGAFARYYAGDLAVGASA
jgi:BirA family transcriptional regulator, biotin operon repressor / biotin---[acetyl-CoA-carboxylase] ligase